MRFNLLWLVAFSAFAQVSIPTFCGNNSRTCANTSEAVLTPTTVASGNFRQLGSFAVTGQIYAQPLFAAAVSTSGGIKNVLVVATMHGTIYGFDADAPGSAALWSNHLNDPRTSFEAPRGGADFYNAELGCMATPVLDVSGGYAYAVCAGPAADASATWTLYQVSLSDGSLVNSVVIAGSVAGTGSGGSTVTFSAVRQLLRCALLLTGGKVYVAFGSYADQDPWFGWLIAYDASTLAQTAIVAQSPNAKNVGLWMSGGGPAADASNNVYIMTGNTLTSTYTPTTDLTESFIKYSPALAVLDYFTPSDHAARDASDYDLGSSWPILIPSTNLIAGSGKRNSGYVVDVTDMGHLEGGGGTAPQVITKASAFTDCVGCGTFASAMYMNSTLYWANKGGFQGQNKMFSFALSGTTFATSPTATGATSYACCGAQMFGSSNGASGGVIWALTPNTSLFSALGTGTFRAFDPSTLAEIYTGPSIGNMPKFMHPVAVNGRVYVATMDGSVLVFGLSSSAVKGRVRTQGQAAIH